MSEQFQLGDRVIGNGYDSGATYIGKLVARKGYDKFRSDSASIEDVHGNEWAVRANSLRPAPQPKRYGVWLHESTIGTGWVGEISPEDYHSGSLEQAKAMLTKFAKCHPDRVYEVREYASVTVTEPAKPADYGKISRLGVAVGDELDAIARKVGLERKNLGDNLLRMSVEARANEKWVVWNVSKGRKHDDITSTFATAESVCIGAAGNYPGNLFEPRLLAEVEKAKVTDPPYSKPPTAISDAQFTGKISASKTVLFPVAEAISHGFKLSPPRATVPVDTLALFLFAGRVYASGELAKRAERRDLKEVVKIMWADKAYQGLRQECEELVRMATEFEAGGK
jgi:hypothetical protein